MSDRRPTFVRREEGYIHMGPHKAKLKQNAYPEIPTTTTSASSSGNESQREEIMLDEIRVQKDLHLSAETV